MKILTYLLISLISMVLALPIYALSYNLPTDGDNVVGQVWVEQAQEKENLSDIAMRTGFGFYELVEANPHLPRHKALPAGTEVIIPGEFILPNAPREGLVINLAELRIYYYPPNSNTVMTFPIAIGKEGWRTPLANTQIIQKVKDPAWRVPDSIRAESARHGEILPAIVPPGPKNPLGRYAIYLSIPGIRIHGTLAPHSIGMRGSHGCMRMYAEDIESLYNAVSIGTPVRIINQPNKIGYLDSSLYIESHVALKDYAMPEFNIHETAAKTLGIDPSAIHIDENALTEATREQNGMPQAIGQMSSYPIYHADYNYDNPLAEGN